MSGQFPFDSGGGGDEEGVPLKLMAFVGVIALLGGVFFFVAMSINRKPLRPDIDPSDPSAFEQNDASVQETPDLWVPKKQPGIPPPTGTTPALPSPLDNPLTKPPELKPLFPSQQPTSKPS
jgi:hypothetical protein